MNKIGINGFGHLYGLRELPTLEDMNIKVINLSNGNNVKCKIKNN